MDDTAIRTTCDQRRALITGISGQDGSYLAELLIGKGYAVHGTVRAQAVSSMARLNHLRPFLTLHPLDLLAQDEVDHVIRKVQPHEVYNLAAQSFVPASWQEPEATGQTTALGPVRLLEAIRRWAPDTRFYQASSSEMYGDTDESPQSERAPFRPRNPYATAKLYAYWMTKHYREQHGLFACSGIMFNHESPRRSVRYVTRKIARSAVQIKLGMADQLRLGDLNARRDWGFAGDYVQAMWLMLQQEKADDYVIGTGEAHSVEEFVDTAFHRLGLDWKRHVTCDHGLCRPQEATLLVADPSKAHRQLNWQPKVDFQELVSMMVDTDLARLSQRRKGQGKAA